jgi:hypothetical protein
MSITYSTAAKTARMQAIADLIDGGTGAGSLEIGTAGMASVLATLPLADPCGSAAGGVLTFDMDPDIEDAAADASGKPGGFRIKDGDGTELVTGIAAGPWVASTAYAAGDYVTADSGKLYHCTTAGTSASSGGPSGTDDAISDGTAVWEWVASEGWGVALEAALITEGQAVTLTTGTITHA